jgi:hypothetical protein
MLIEAAKLAPHWNEQLAMVHERALKEGNRNRATLAVARRLVAYLLAVDKKTGRFQASHRNAGSLKQKPRNAYRFAEMKIFPPGLAVWGLCMQ